jgi:hypothetical protein
MRAKIPHQNMLQEIGKLKGWSPARDRTKSVEKEIPVGTLHFGMYSGNQHMTSFFASETELNRVFLKLFFVIKMKRAKKNHL